MKLREVLKFLKQKGAVQNRKIYERHGARDPMYGVSFASLNMLKKKIKTDHALALKLWDTGNMNCRTLALMVADPGEMTSALAEAWVKQADYKVLAGELASLIARSKLAETKMKKWMRSKKEYIQKCGYDILSCRLVSNDTGLAEDLIQYMDTIENQIHLSPDLARHVMVMALIAIGIYRPGLERQVVQASRRVGTVRVDHGKTGCKTPEVEPYIARARKRKN